VRIAYFSPLNPRPTGIADYGEELLPYLAQHAKLDLFVDDYHPDNPAITEQFEIFHYRRFSTLQRRRNYDARLYHVGNHPAHKYIHDTLLHYPGITTLHDHVLHHFYRSTTLESGDPTAYVREMGYNHGWRGFEHAHRALHHTRPFIEYTYPLAARVLEASLGIIVHNEHTRRHIALSHPDVPLTKINHHLDPQIIKNDPDTASQARTALGLSADQFIIASFGHIAPTKHIDTALYAFARFRQAFPHAVYLLVGDVVPDYNIQSIVKKLDLDDNVILTGHVSKEDFRRYMTISDVCINLRYPTAGETSGSLIRVMGTGKPVIVSDIDAFSELPDTTCVKVGIGQEKEVLLSHLLTLARDPNLRQRIGHSAQQHVQTHHRIEDSARAYVHFIAHCLDLADKPR
jgi:glycosyltransferase involved in cell wall biosynthesis